MSWATGSWSFGASCLISRMSPIIRLAEPRDCSQESPALMDCRQKPISPQTESSVAES